MVVKARGKLINLALQGGGSHGALTWGVLDRLLEDDHLAIAEISGTSAGAMNAVVLADGFQRGGRDGARTALHDFWKAVSDAARFSPIQRSPWDRVTGNYSLDLSPGWAEAWLDAHYEALGTRSTLDLDAWFVDPGVSPQAKA